MIHLWLIIFYYLASVIMIIKSLLTMLNSNLKLFTILIIILHLPFCILAQESVNVGNANFSGENGTVSASIGQVFYSFAKGENGNVSEGVQQPYDITALFINNDDKATKLICSIYPNPTIDLVRVSIEYNDFSKLNYSLFDLNGRLLEQGKIIYNQFDISLPSSNSSAFLLKIADDQNILKVFQIIKNEQQ
jgi:hypothetical protein